LAVGREDPGSGFRGSADNVLNGAEEAMSRARSAIDVAIKVTASLLHPDTGRGESP